MRCTQEQFDKIKDRLPGITDDDFDLETYKYLVNNYNGTLIAIGSSLEVASRIVYETWNNEIFLNACGIETENIFQSGELQFRNPKEENTWIDCFGDFEFRIKPQPNYEQEIQALQDKAKENGMKAVITFEKL